MAWKYFQLRPCPRFRPRLHHHPRPRPRLRPVTSHSLSLNWFTTKAERKVEQIVLRKMISLGLLRWPASLVDRCLPALSSLLEYCQPPLPPQGQCCSHLQHIYNTQYTQCVRSVRSALAPFDWGLAARIYWLWCLIWAEEEKSTPYLRPALCRVSGSGQRSVLLSIIDPVN